MASEIKEDAEYGEGEIKEFAKGAAITEQYAYKIVRAGTIRRRCAEHDPAGRIFSKLSIKHGYLAYDLQIKYTMTDLEVFALLTAAAESQPVTPAEYMAQNAHEEQRALTDQYAGEQYHVNGDQPDKSPKQQSSVDKALALIGEGESESDRLAVQFLNLALKALQMAATKRSFQALEFAITTVIDAINQPGGSRTLRSPQSRAGETV